MPIVSMENQYIKDDGTLTYEGQNLLQDLLDTAEAAVSIDNLSDVTITTATTGQILRYNGTVWANTSVVLQILLDTQTASASAQLDFTAFNNAVYSQYLFELDNVKPATDGSGLWCRFSTNGGSSYDAGAGNYTWSYTGVASAADTFIALGLAQGNAAAERGVSGWLIMRNAGNASQHTRVSGEGSGYSTTGVIQSFTMAGARLADQDTDAIRFLMSSGNIASGTIRMYGIVG